MDQQSKIKRAEWIEYVALFLVGGGVLVGCGDLHKLAKSDRKPVVDLNLPAKASNPVPVREAVDTALNTITFRKQDGTQLFFNPVEVDSTTGEKLMSVAIDEVVISAGTRRNLVERNGKINVEYVVTVPEALQNNGWRLVVDPRLSKGPDTLSLSPLVYTGSKFRTMQQREYLRYEDYLAALIDSTELFERFGNKKVYARYMQYVAKQRAKYATIEARLAQLSPQEAACDRKVGWLTPGERQRQYTELRNYIRSVDRHVRENATYQFDTTAKFDYLEDYFRPRYRYGEVDVLPGGEIYTRVQGEYPEAGGRARETYIRALSARPTQVRYHVRHATRNELPELVRQRLAYTGLKPDVAGRALRTVSDSATVADYQRCQEYAAEQLATLGSTDTNAVRRAMLRAVPVRRNQQRIDAKDRVYQELVQHPYFANARLDTVIHRPDGKIDYYCTDEVVADENTSKLYLFLAGNVEDRNGNTYHISRSDTLTYNVASMTSFLDESTHYMQRVIVRDAQANARFFFTFPASKSELDETLPENRQQIAAVRRLTYGLMTDPVYIIDSITLRATASPEGTWQINERLARERSEALRRVVVAEFRGLYDSLRIAASYTLDENGRQVLMDGDRSLPNLPNIVRTKWLAEDWDEVSRLVAADTLLSDADKQHVYASVQQIASPDARDWHLRTNFPQLYKRLRTVIYPQMRAVDFRFNLHRRGMQQDTVYTTEVDSNYMHAVDLLRKRRYDDALTILRPYEDRNTALAYMSLGYDAAAYRILRGEPNVSTSPDIQYMLAILAARLGDEEQAVIYFLRAVELRPGLKFRGNLDPEVSRLIRKYGLFKDEF